MSKIKVDERLAIEVTIRELEEKLALAKRIQDLWNSLFVDKKRMHGINYGMTPEQIVRDRTRRRHKVQCKQCGKVRLRRQGAMYCSPACGKLAWYEKTYKRKARPRRAKLRFTDRKCNVCDSLFSPSGARDTVCGRERCRILGLGYTQLRRLGYDRTKADSLRKKYKAQDRGTVLVHGDPLRATGPDVV